jgi:GT2 family glycosyltransferase
MSQAAARLEPAASPLVTCLISTYNYGRFLGKAIESVLCQRYPADRLEVIVVDDGSTDDTRAVVEPYLSRVRYVHKPNGGLLSTIDRGLREASGELISFLSADDEWAPDKTSRQAALMGERPGLGLVYSDLEVVNDAGETLHPSLWRQYGLIAERGRPLGTLLRRNIVSGGTIMFRSSLRSAIHPFPAEAAWEDWWMAFRISQLAELDFIAEPLYRYRLHGDNMNFGAEGEKFAGILRDELPFRRYMLSHVGLDEARSEDLIAGLAVLGMTAERASSALRESLEALLPVSAAERAEAQQDIALAREARDGSAVTRYLVRALARDPFNEEAKRLLDAVPSGATRVAPPTPAAAVDGRRFKTLAFAEELRRRPELLRRYGGVFGSEDDATLVILAPGSTEDELTAALQPALERAGLDGADSPDMLGLALPADASLGPIVASVAALLSAEERPDLRLMRFDETTIDELRVLAGSSPTALGPAAGQPEVSIIVLTLNQLEHTQRCIASVLAHTRRSFELIVVDNGSTDGTLGYLQQLAATDWRVAVIANSSNRGFSGGNNLGLALARGEHALLLNNDTIVTPGWLDLMLGVMHRHPRTGLVGPMSNNVSGPQQIEGAAYGDDDERALFAARVAREHGRDSREIMRLVGFCLLVRGALLKRIGGLDERYGSGNFEDDDYCLRSLHAGFENRVALGAFVHHVGGRTFAGQGIAYNSTLERNWMLFKAKWGIPPGQTTAEGYRFPPEAPTDGLSMPLPLLHQGHQIGPDGRIWRERTDLERVA